MPLWSSAETIFSRSIPVLVITNLLIQVAGNPSLNITEAGSLKAELPSKYEKFARRLQHGPAPVYRIGGAIA
jgi:hypothetical protein